MQKIKTLDMSYSEFVKSLDNCEKKLQIELDRQLIECNQLLLAHEIEYDNRMKSRRSFRRSYRNFRTQCIRTITSIFARNYIAKTSYEFCESYSIKKTNIRTLKY